MYFKKGRMLLKQSPMLFKKIGTLFRDFKTPSLQERDGVRPVGILFQLLGILFAPPSQNDIRKRIWEMAAATCKAP